MRLGPHEHTKVVSIYLPRTLVCPCPSQHTGQPGLCLLYPDSVAIPAQWSRWVVWRAKYLTRLKADNTDHVNVPCSEPERGCWELSDQGEQGMMIKAWDVYGLVDKENKAWWSRHEMSTAWLTRRTRYDDQGMRCLRLGWQGEQGMIIKAWDVYGLVDKENKAW